MGRREGGDRGEVRLLDGGEEVEDGCGDRRSPVEEGETGDKLKG
jgi:hypothetical protein